MTAPLVRVERLTVTFAGHRSPAVNNVSFEVQPGSCVALVGESGSGKSLTARAILGLLPEGATRTGRILLGEDPAPPNGSTGWNAIRGSRTGLVPQDALGGLDPLRRIELEVGDTLRLHRLAPRREIRERVVRALDAAGMPEPEQQLRKRSDELSGGLRQRTLVASALIGNPELLVADEPTTALDADHRSRVLDELRRRVDAGAGALLISHDLASVRDVADVVLVMRDGEIIERGSPARVFHSPQQAFTRELISASPANRPRGTRLLEPSGPVTHALPGESTDASASAAAPEGDGRSVAKLELQRITAAYGRGPRRREVLRSASLEVRAGETVGLVGESGSGKTTLLRIALGLHQQFTGTVRIDGEDRDSASGTVRRAMRRRLALVPQDPLNSFPRGATGVSLLHDALRAASVPRRERRERATRLAHEVGLDPELLTRGAHTLSGGQRQRLALARALAREPELLLLDEPVSALDVTVQARVLDLLDDLQARHGTAFLFVSHDRDVIEHMSDRVLTLSDGSITAQ